MMISVRNVLMYRPSPPQWRCRSLPIVALIVWYCCVGVTGYSAASELDILILNTDASISRYRSARLGFEELMNGRCLEFDIRQGRYDHGELAATVQRIEPRVVYCIGSAAYHVAESLSVHGDILVSSALRPEKIAREAHVYGVYNEPPILSQLVMIRDIFPAIRRIGVLNSRRHNRKWVQSAKAAGRNSELTITSLAVNHPDDVVTRLQRDISELDALWFIPDPVVMDSEDAILAIFGICDAYKVPVFAYDPVYAEVGATLVIAVDSPTVGRQAAALARNVMKHKPPRVRFQHPVGTRIILNRKNVTNYNLVVNKHALGSINEIIR